MPTAKLSGLISPGGVAEVPARIIGTAPLGGSFASLRLCVRSFLHRSCQEAASPGRKENGLTQRRKGAKILSVSTANSKPEEAKNSGHIQPSVPSVGRPTLS